MNSPFNQEIYREINGEGEKTLPLNFANVDYDSLIDMVNQLSIQSLIMNSDHWIIGTNLEGKPFKLIINKNTLEMAMVDAEVTFEEFSESFLSFPIYHSKDNFISVFKQSDRIKAINYKRGENPVVDENIGFDHFILAIHDLNI